ncbi:MAG: class I SAM-dependent methyltransferase [Chloroflexi bacterium]|nr:class I SAM-dependent methyltransferase [Chloroflexota bacterium]
MNPDQTPKDPQTIHSENLEIWERNAIFWDEKMGEGNQFQRVLIAPATERLLEIRPGENVLDAACGNGVFARRLAELGARVTAFDQSPALLELARQRSAGKPYTANIEYLQIDATDQAQLLTLGLRQFDAVVCNMALMDIPDIHPLLDSISRLLKEDGRFVFSVLHPCFNSTGCTLVMEQEDGEKEVIITRAIKVHRYLQPRVSKGVAILGQPVQQYYFERPLSVLLNACFEAGFILDGIEEPAFGETDTNENPLNWVNLKEIPPVLIARLRLR